MKALVSIALAVLSMSAFAFDCDNGDSMYKPLYDKVKKCGTHCSSNVNTIKKLSDGWTDEQAASFNMSINEIVRNYKVNVNPVSKMTYEYFKDEASRSCWWADNIEATRDIGTTRWNPDTGEVTNKRGEVIETIKPRLYVDPNTGKATVLPKKSK